MAKNTVVVSILSDTKDLAKGFKETDGIVGRVGKGLGSLAKIGAGAAVAVAGVGAALGFRRLAQLDSARTKMSALGLTGEEVEGAMGAALASVRGTAFGLGDAANVASLALGAGIRDSERLEESLKAVSNAAAIGQAPLQEIGLIFNKTWARGRVTMEEINQLNTRGIAIQGMLSETLGVTTDELTTMISQGLVSAEDLEQAFLDAGDAAVIMGDDLSGRTANALASLGRIGAGALLPIFDTIKTGMGEIVIFLNGVEELLAPVFAGWNERFTESVNLEGAGQRLLDGLQSIASADFSFDGILSAVQNGLNSAIEWLQGGGLTALVEGFLSGRQQLFDGILELIPVVIDAIMMLIPALIALAPEILSSGLAMFSALVDAVVQIVPPLIQQLLALLPTLITTLLGMIPELINTAVELFTTLVAAIPIILPQLITTIVDLLPVVAESILSMLPGILDAAVNLFTALIGAIPIILPVLVRALVDLLPVLVITVINMIPKLLDAAIDLFIALVEAVPVIIPELIKAILDLLPVLIGAIITMVPKLLQAGVDLIGGLISGLWREAGSLASALIDIVSGAVGGFLSFLGINSPSKLFEGFGMNIDEGLAKGLRKGAGKIGDAMGAVNAAVTDGFDAELDGSGLNLAVSTKPGAGSSGGDTFNITINSLNPTAEVGRLVVEAIEDYKRFGGRRGQAVFA